MIFFVRKIALIVNVTSVGKRLRIAKRRQVDEMLVWKFRKSMRTIKLLYFQTMKAENRKFILNRIIYKTVINTHDSHDSRRYHNDEIVFCLKTQINQSSVYSRLCALGEGTLL